MKKKKISPSAIFFSPIVIFHISLFLLLMFLGVLQAIEFGYSFGLSYVPLKLKLELKHDC